MTVDTRPPAEIQRAQARRTQILDAAADCFREHGFHGASIARISKAAAMSAGHIYHYFDNKEAIIAAIVARDLEHLLSLTTSLRSAHDVLEAMLAAAAAGAENNLEAQEAGLQLEIVAEAARNPHVADIVRQADLSCRTSLAETLRLLRRGRGHEDDEQALAARVEVLAAMFDGLMIRCIRNPDLNREAVIRVFLAAVRDLLDQR
jgi:AcrR family transcriptional regulator